MKSDNNIDIFFLGDTYFGEWHMRLRGRKGQYNVLEEKGYLHFAGAFNPLLNEGDLVVANLECAITDIPKSPFEEEKRHTYAADREKTIEALKNSNISVVTLANNHAVDFGKAGLIDTLEALEENNISYLGGGRGIDQARAPFFFRPEKDGTSLHLAIVSCYNYGAKSEEYGFYATDRVPGVNRLSADSIRNQVKTLKKEHPDILYIAVPHWGPNYAWRTFRQQKQAEELIRAGVDIIIGHSAHMMQEIEYIKNRLVVYSIGNFILNGNGEFKRRNLPPYSFIARLHFAPDEEDWKKSLLLYPFVSDNLGTDFTPRYVNEHEFEQIMMILRGHNFNMKNFDKCVRGGKDSHGCYIECDIE